MNVLKCLALCILIWIIVTSVMAAGPVVCTSEYLIPNESSGIEASMVEGEIKVKGNTQSISDGDSKPSPKDSTYFGIADIDTGRITVTYWIYYDGPDQLEITGNIISSASDFSITQQPAQTILASGDSVSFSVTFDPNVPDTLQATIVIPNNVSDQGSFTFDVLGVSTAIIEMEVKGNEQVISNGDVAPREADHTFFGEADVTTETITRTFWIHSIGNYELLIGPILSSDEHFIVEQPLTNLIPEGDSLSFKVTFDPDMAGDVLSFLTIPSTDNQGNHPYVFAVAATGTDNPIIEVRGNQQRIENGDDSPSEADHTRFGRINFEGATRTRTYRIYNLGTADLHITDLISSSQPEFTVNQPEGLSAATPLTILPGESLSFSITFDPEDMGPAEAIISIPNDDVDHSLYVFHVAGNGSGHVDISVKGNQQLIAPADMTPTSADSTDFGQVFQNRDSKTVMYWIVNTGIDTLNITDSISSNHPHFTITQPTDTLILAGDSISFSVTFTPVQEEEVAALITIPNDDVDKNPYTFLVRGEGIPYVNGVPVAVDDHFSTPKNTSLYASVLTDDGIDTLSHDGGHSVYLLTDPEYGMLTFHEDGNFTYSPPENFWGEVQFDYQLCDADEDCAQATVTLLVEGSGVTTYNAFSPDNDGVNDGWEIDNIHNYPANHVAIFNRWGNKVWEARGYNNQNVIWKGDSNTGLKLGDQLPDGTYFYIIELEDLSPEQGYIILSRKR